MKLLNQTTKKAGEFITIGKNYTGGDYKAGDIVEILNIVDHEGMQMEINCTLNGEVYFQGEKIREKLYETEKSTVWPEETVDDFIRPIVLTNVVSLKEFRK